MNLLLHAVFKFCTTNVYSNKYELKIFFTECRDCELSWGEWGECYNKFRSRAEFISSPVVGAGSCPSPGIETEGKNHKNNIFIQFMQSTQPPTCENWLVTSRQIVS